MVSASEAFYILVVFKPWSLLGLLEGSGLGLTQAYGLTRRWIASQVILGSTA